MAYAFASAGLDLCGPWVTSRQGWVSKQVINSLGEKKLHTVWRVQFLGA